MKDQPNSVNFPETDDGRTYHFGVKRGEVANRIITVEDPSKALTIEKLLDRNPKPYIFNSKRGFLTITGRYRSIPISIISIYHGFAMMDLFIREARHVVDGPLVIIRLGTCGSIGSPSIGDIMIPTGSFAVTKNYDYFIHGIDTKDAFPIVDNPYNISKITYCDREMCEMLQKELGKFMTKMPIFTGINACTDSFYSSQGRLDDNFLDENHEVLSSIFQKYPNAQTMDMETFTLYHLSNVSLSSSIPPQPQQVHLPQSKQLNSPFLQANNSSQISLGRKSLCNTPQRMSFDLSTKQRHSMDVSRRMNNTFSVSKNNNLNVHQPHRHHLNNSSTNLNSYNQIDQYTVTNSIRSTAVLIVFNDRKTNESISEDTVNLLEPWCSEACLNTLMRIEVIGSHEEEGSVWSYKLTEKKSQKKGSKIVRMIKRKLSA
ncbi:9211_t:CDS:2 [Funneliformis mosseae]|uniref:9211_t:CDS:1 n=1 Tax=Funneliformis mosseae TaxID=27381 RepID=A0A9N9A5Q0_FUNMO|nr:9211_t:CDS:2 [Funneliformis mosseae]